MFQQVELLKFVPYLRKTEIHRDKEREEIERDSDRVRWEEDMPQPRPRKAPGIIFWQDYSFARSPKIKSRPTVFGYAFSSNCTRTGPLLPGENSVPDPEKCRLRGDRIQMNESERWKIQHSFFRAIPLPSPVLSPRIYLFLLPPKRVVCNDLDVGMLPLHRLDYRRPPFKSTSNSSVRVLVDILKFEGGSMARLYFNSDRFSDSPTVPRYIEEKRCCSSLMTPIRRRLGEYLQSVEVGVSASPVSRRGT
ncbi:hypothetical protein IW261DRAFT_1428489 [Armillaria novae-zelandiae]|uniref:Uncharacterized protein n=1 Tax=Armillaria novae-zelandiae TaxID=153914 RepID=A0AA39N9H7_9AGAR|nr:hypothetical protein IW261DRAFT_1428487 [Armillaria novae-zelandiae]KAK0461514.1 hypothetical protein IW261DRAFT_1428489 [Armillaria novae-zelandiae]